MIDMFEYTRDEVDFIYSEIERACMNRDKYEHIDIHRISLFVKAGDFYLRGYAANGPLFEFNGPRWVENGEIYRVLFQTWPLKNHPLAEFIPVITVDGNKVTVAVGEVEHAMMDAHYIQWITLETEQGRQRKILNPGEKPVAEFALVEGDKAVAAYEYCNLHGLWKAEV